MFYTALSLSADGLQHRHKHASRRIKFNTSNNVQIALRRKRRANLLLIDSSVLGFPFCISKFRIKSLSFKVSKSKVSISIGDFFLLNTVLMLKRQIWLLILFFWSLCFLGESPFPQLSKWRTKQPTFYFPLTVLEYLYVVIFAKQTTQCNQQL